MIICEEHKLLYLAPPKTGSVTVLRKLENTPPFNGVRPDALYAHHNSFWCERFGDFYIFITVRHPYTRMLSFWRFVLAQIDIANSGDKSDNNKLWWCEQFRGIGPTFHEFVHKTDFESFMRAVWSCHWHADAMQKSADMVVHQESYLEDMQKIPLLKDIDFTARENEGPALEPGKAWYDYFTPDVVVRVQDLWGGDFERYGYNRDFKECAEGKLFA
jgi:hypothetical protein